MAAMAIRLVLSSVEAYLAPNKASQIGQKLAVTFFANCATKRHQAFAVAGGRYTQIGTHQ